ncbi:MAG: ABC transporter ATP-binding protein [Alphaproteobacteria bacterium]|uniref:ABC transporter ATP-binding protein n=1 Tax=PS1 clade bacterium TaxID=2175152 RepID=A0A368DM06_9PROT|nr:MAG: ABC transporter ATP-binding protein [PS1 clade bacterium]|tara:strand:+ start:14377 stop:15078 length:702 start_codon:yes stop_codon:yes gene_type:complete
MNNNHIYQSDNVLLLDSISRTYNQGNNEIKVLDNVNLSVKKGEIVSLIGNSGSGKSSLLHIAGLLELPNSGEILINDIKFSAMSEKERTISRRNSIGFIYQFHHLLSDFTAIDNIMIPMLIAGHQKSYAKDKAEKLLSKLELFDRKDHLPSQMSGGEQQRVSIARSLANNPDILLADEPTGNLDSKTADIVFNQFLDLAKDENMSVLLATHNIKLSDKSDRVISLQNGSLLEG